MTEQTFFGKGLEEIAGETSEREKRIKGEEEWLVFATADKKDTLQPLKDNSEIVEIPITFSAFTPKDEFKTLAKINLKLNNTGATTYFGNRLVDFCGFNNKVYVLHSLSEVFDLEQSILSVLKKDGLDKVRKIRTSRSYSAICSNADRIYIAGLSLCPFDQEPDDDIKQEQFIYHLDKELNIVSSDVISNRSMWSDGLKSHKAGYVLPQENSEVLEGSEVQVISHKGELFYLDQTYDGETNKLALRDGKGNARIIMHLNSDPQDILQERIDAEVFGKDLYLSGFIAKEDFKFDRRYGVIRIVGAEEGIKGPYNGKPLIIHSERLEQRLILEEQELHSFKKVKYKDLAYLVERK
jgi:hypothetical protein